MKTARSTEHGARSATKIEGKGSWQSEQTYVVELPARGTLVYEVRAVSRRQALERCRQGEVAPTSHEIATPHNWGLAAVFPKEAP
jgi:hypothetical protein